MNAFVDSSFHNLLYGSIVDMSSNVAAVTYEPQSCENKDADKRSLVIKNTSEPAGLAGKIPSPPPFSQENTDPTGALVR
jgi:hypothetical protein